MAKNEMPVCCAWAERGAKKPPAGGFFGEPEMPAYLTIWFSSPLA
jgi:hypothetical protein